MSEPTKVFILIEHGSNGDPAKVCICHTEEERERRTREAIADPDESANEILDADINTLREDHWLEFEGDPPLQWVDGFLT